jgi:hypothetical protein
MEPSGTEVDALMESIGVDVDTLIERIGTEVDALTVPMGLEVEMMTIGSGIDGLEPTTAVAKMERMMKKRIVRIFSTQESMRGVEVLETNVLCRRLY